MKILVGFNGEKASKKALALACEHAKIFNAAVYVVTSMEGGVSEKAAEIRKTEDDLQYARSVLKREGVDGEVSQLARGLSPGEDLVQYAEDTGMAGIYIGIEKRSRVQKILLGSTAQYIILKAPCPVTTIKV